MTTTRYQEIVKHYEQCLEQYGDTHRGVDWPKAEDVATRYRVMLDVVRPTPVAYTLLDFGCGAAHLYEYLQRHPRPGLRYSGLDVSPKFVALCRRKFPELTFYELDLLRADEAALPGFDYIVMNGVLTEKRGLSHAEMLEYAEHLLARAFRKARVGLAFNVMSSHVDWERDDLFHVPLDELAALLLRSLSRHFVVRNDYGLYEYTTYVYRGPHPSV